MSDYKLWLLRPRDDRPDDPWSPWYDKAFGFVVRAASEEEARKMAHEEAGNENRGEFLRKKIADTTEPWLDPTYSTCERMADGGEPGVVICDLKSA